MSRAKRRADRIKEEVSILEVLAQYGYSIHTGYDGEQQFRCDLHGTGHDNKPSARVYPDTNSTYCWACGRSRDPISYVMEKEGKEFMDALYALESRFNLSQLPWEDDDFVKKESPKIVEEVEEALAPETTLQEDQQRLEKLLLMLTHERSLPLGRVLDLWEGLDRIAYYAGEGMVSESAAQQALIKLLSKAKEPVCSH